MKYTKTIKNKPIVSHEESTEMDKLLSEYSYILFPYDHSKNIFQIDDNSRKIISLIAQNGISNQNQLTTKGKIIKLKRDVIRRRLGSRKSKSYNLSTTSFVIKVDGVKKQKNKTKKYYGLDFKGLLVSLGEIYFEDNYLIKKFSEFILKWSGGNKYLASIVIQFLKYNVALMMIWHSMNGMDLTRQVSSFRYFSLSNKTNPLLNPDSVIPFSSNNNDHKRNLHIINKFFVISCILDMLIKNSTNGEVIRRYLKDWTDCIAWLQFENIDSYNYDEELGPLIISADHVNERSILVEAEHILNSLNLKVQKHLKKIPIMFESDI